MADKWAKTDQAAEGECANKADPARAVPNPHSGHRERLRQRYRQEGLDNFSEHQILELLLFYSFRQQDTNELAHSLLAQFGSLAGVFDAEYEDLLQVKGVGANTALLLSLLPDVLRRYQMSLHAPRPSFQDRAAVARYVKNLFIGVQNEVFYLICLNKRNTVTQEVKINEGTVDSVTLEPRLVVEAALRCKAKNVIFAHNHPGGSLKPSSTDLHLTNRLAGILLGVGIEVIDHIIICGDQYLSFYEKGLLPRV